MNGDMIVALVGVVAALFLAMRGLRSHGLSFEKKATMAVVWIVIIVILAFIITRFQSVGA